ncbi:MAG: hypothetical protein QF898_09785, partial [SAR202 cluster bacterium]|nr:hypothetical protein [SAR202 cluster bacterium]
VRVTGVVRLSTRPFGFGLRVAGLQATLAMLSGGEVSGRWNSSAVLDSTRPFGFGLRVAGLLTTES